MTITTTDLLLEATGVSKVYGAIAERRTRASLTPTVSRVSVERDHR